MDKIKEKFIDLKDALVAEKGEVPAACFVEIDRGGEDRKAALLLTGSLDEVANLVYKGLKDSPDSVILAFSLAVARVVSKKSKQETKPEAKQEKREITEEEIEANMQKIMERLG